jgi:hypothetical protein
MRASTDIGDPKAARVVLMVEVELMVESLCAIVDSTPYFAACDTRITAVQLLRR